MKINLRFRYLWPILAVLLADRAYSELVVADEYDPRLRTYGLVVQGLMGLLLLAYWRALPALLRGWALAVLAALAALSLESYAGWGSWAVYPHVFSKLLALVFTLGLAAYYCRYGLPPLGPVAALMLGGLVANLVLLHPEVGSMSAFVNNERGVHAYSAMLLLLPTLYYFNQYLARGGTLRQLAFWGGAGLIVFLQHRSVWLASGLALGLNLVLLALGRVAGARPNTRRLLQLGVVPLLALTVGGLALLTDPRVRYRLNQSVEDILHADKQGTGSWRLLQFEAYAPFIQDHPVAGMRLRGFELPVQFFSPDGDAPVWVGRTGHHFHSFYVDRLFYFGGLGLALTLLVPLLLLGRRLRQPLPLPPGVVALVLFSLSTLLFGASYDWPGYFYALLGLTLAGIAPTRALTRRPGATPGLASPPTPTDPSNHPSDYPPNYPPNRLPVPAAQPALPPATAPRYA